MTISPIEVVKDNLQINAVELRDISKKYYYIKGVNPDFKDFWALKDISFNISEGRIFGIIGRNGAGKTTLLSIIAGVLSATKGEVLLNGRVLKLFNLGVGFQDELTGRENIFLNGAILGATKKEIENRLSSIIEFSEIGNFIDMPIGSYSQGMRLRLGFSIVANLDFDILAIDEVLAVGDALFQSKCYERLMDFKRMGKTLIITCQDMAMVERLCDEAALIDHGRLLFQGKSKEAIDKYRALLNKEQFFVGPESKRVTFVENTKKWADDTSEWGKKIGTKEVIIDSVKIINKYGFRHSRIKTGEPLKIRVDFTVKNNIKEPHFGIAIFREDGVYCYGPNTKFDGYNISEIKHGKGYFILKYEKLLLAPGNYRVSVAIWDKNETVAFDYHNGYYKLMVIGCINRNNGLLNIPFKFRYMKNKTASFMNPCFCTVPSKNTAMTIKLFNSSECEKNRFITDEAVRFDIIQRVDKDMPNGSYLWLGIYRDDGICCQTISAPYRKKKKAVIFFPKLPLLPGFYKISVGIYNKSCKMFLIKHADICHFQMVFDKQDHGTVYLKHKWNLKKYRYDSFK
jgi:lipopolysaccharide transport system ATP-binding protein